MNWLRKEETELEFIESGELLAIFTSISKKLNP